MTTKHKRYYASLVTVVVVAVLMLGSASSKAKGESTDPVVGMINPSYGVCEEQGGKAIDSFCHLPDGSKTELMEFFYHLKGRAYYCLKQGGENDNEQTESGGDNVCHLPDDKKLEFIFPEEGGRPDRSYRFCEEKVGIPLNGFCHFPDGSKSELWAFFRRHHPSVYYCLKQGEGDREQTGLGVRNVCHLYDGSKIEFLFPKS